MSGIITATLRAVSAESLKLKGTLALRLCFIAPGLVVLLSVLQLLLSKGGQPLATPALAWERFIQGVMLLWAFLMLPLYVTLQSALLAGLEHGERQWKHLLALPVPRSAHYLGKLIILIGMVMLATLVLAVLIPLGGGVLMQLHNPLGIGGAVPWTFLGLRALVILAASGCIIGLHLWIALRWTSFTVAVATGMTATVAGFLIGQSARFGPWYPWTLPMQVFAGQGELMGQVALAGVVGGLVAVALGLWDFLRREYA